MKKYASILYSLFCLMLLVECGEDRTYEYEEKTASARWIESSVKEWYLWSDNVGELSWNDYFLKGENFLNKLTAASKGQDKWTYCAVDTLVTDYHQRGTFNHLDSYGLDVVVMTDPTGVTSRQYGRVVTVYKNSPAERLGLQRNDFIATIDGKRLNSSNVSNLIKGHERTIEVAKLGFDLEQQTYFWYESVTLTLPSSEYVEDKAFPLSDVYDLGGVKAGYLICTRLVERAYEKDGTDKAYREELDRIMTNFKAEGVGALVVDLRLCNYGEMSMVSRLAAYIAGRAGESLLKTQWKPSKSDMDEVVKFDASVTRNSLNLQRVYFITRGYTCGAAEWLIHGLRGVLGEENVCVIGDTTAGQNVQTYPVTSPEYFITLHLAAATVLDVNDKPCSTIVPTEEIKELTMAELYPYGDTREVLLNAALQAITAN